MVGFIQANEFRQFDDATKSYKLFLQKYPNHSLSKAAKDELDNMGLSADQILNNKIGKDL